MGRDMPLGPSRAASGRAKNSPAQGKEQSKTRAGQKGDGKGAVGLPLHALGLKDGVARAADPSIMPRPLLRSPKTEMARLRGGESIGPQDGWHKKVSGQSIT